MKRRKFREIRSMKIGERRLYFGFCSEHGGRFQSFYKRTVVAGLCRKCRYPKVPKSQMPFRFLFGD